MKKLLSSVFIVLFTISSFSQDVFLVNDSREKSEKIALVILNGFGDSKKNRKKQKKFFENKGYDLFIPEYIERESINKSIKRLTFWAHSIFPPAHHPTRGGGGGMDQILRI